MGTPLWVVDWRDAKLYAYSMSDRSRDAGKDFALDADDQSTEGLWSVGNTMWVASRDDGRLYAYDWNNPATGAPTITGAVRVDETLAAGTRSIADADGLDAAIFEYQWVSNDGNADTDIVGATDSTYTIVSGDRGRTVKVRVSFTDGAGNRESLTSEPTGRVGAPGICDRTPAVMAAIVAGMIGVGDCSEVSETRLRAWTGSHRFGSGVTLGLHLQGRGLSALQAGDFRDLHALRALDLNRNFLETVPDGLFEDLRTVEEIYLSGNLLNELPDGTFDGQTANLSVLDLSANGLETLPEGVLRNLAELVSLSLAGNGLAHLPGGLFDDLVELEELDLSANSIDDLPDGLFDGNLELRDLDLSINEISELPEGVFADLGNLAELDLSGNELEDLPVGVFEGLSGLTDLDAGDNPGAPFTFTAELERRGDDTIVVRIAEGATPFGMTIELSALKGELSAETVTVASGSAYSDVVEVRPHGHHPVTVEIDSAAFLLPSGGSASGIRADRGSDMHLWIGRPLVQREWIQDEDFALHPENASPKSIWSDGETLWVGDDTAAKVFAYKLWDDPGTEASEYGTRDPGMDVPALGQEDFYVTGHGSRLYVAEESLDGASRDVFGYDLTNYTRAEDRDFVYGGLNVAGGVFIVRGTATDGRHLWITNTTSHAHAFRLFDDPETPEDEYGRPDASRKLTIPGRGQLRGLFTDGRTMWGVRFASNDASVRSVKLSDGTEAGFDFPLHEDNDHAYGIWSDGETFYVVVRPFVEDAETAAALIGNTGQSGDAGHDLGSAGAKRAQAFTTGTSKAGYALASVGIEFGEVSNTSSDLEVTLNADGGGVPGDALCTLIALASLSERSVNTFAAPASGTTCPALVKETTYFVVVERVRVTGSGAIAVSGTASGSEDTGAAEGWSIADGSATYSPQAAAQGWASDAFSYKIEARGSFINNPAAGEVTVTGTPQVKGTLAAAVSDVSDDDGLTRAAYSYQWMRVDGATETNIGTGSPTYTLVAEDLGKRIKVRVAFVDDRGNYETLTSEATPSVEAFKAADRPGTVSLFPARPRVGTVVSAALSDPDGLEGGGSGPAASSGAVSWSWARSSDGTAWTGVEAYDDGDSYVPTEEDEGMLLKAEASYTDGHGPGKSAEAVSPAVVGARESGPELTVTEIVTGLSHPWGIDFTPDGTMLFTQRAGVLNARLTDGTVKRVAADLGDLLVDGFAGLQALAVDPDFTTNRRFYTLQGHAGREMQVIAWTIDADYDEATRVVDPLVKGMPIGPGPWHSGGRLLFGPEGYLWIVTGDGRVVTGAQDLTSLGGKVLRVDPQTGAGAPGNPFGASSPVYAYGFRNPQGLALRPGTDQMWLVEHGPKHDDEINLLAPGGNYGWDPIPDDGTLVFYDYSDEAGVPMTDLAKFPSARQARWSSGFPTLATSGAVFLDGPQWGEWEGRLTVATLKTKSLRVFEFTEQGDFAGQIVVPELDGSHGRLRTPVLGPDGALYIATSNRPGSDRILRVSANRAATGAPVIVGTSRVGETLTADTSGITDDDGLTNAVFSYQWVSNDGNADTDIDGETGSTYELSDDDVGKTVKVRVSFTDDAGNEESLTSVPTTAVAPSNHQPEVVPRLREWAGGSGSFALSGSSRVVVVAGDGSRQFSGDFFSIVLGGLTDPEESGLSEAQRSAARLALADSLNATAYHTASRRTLDQVAAKIRDDIEDLTGLSLAVVPASASVSPRAGDVVVDVLDASDAGIAAEGYELAIGDWVTIRANSTSGVFYGSRTLLQMLAGSGDNTAPRGTARDYPTLGHRLIHLDMNRKYWEMDYLADSFRRMSWVKLNAFKIHFADANGWRLHDPGTAAWSGTMSAAPTPDTATEVLATGSLGASTGVKVVPGARSLTVHWNPPSAQSGRDVRSYRVQIRRQGDLAWSPADYRDSAGTGTAYLTVADRSHKFGGLTDGVTYEVRVSADTGFPGLADSRERYQSGDKKWFYDRDDIRMLEGWAAENHISIMPGFEFPGHTSVINDLYETGFADGGSDRCGNAHVYGNVKPGFVLDTTSSRAVAQAKTIMEHFMPWFSGLYVHIGGEEVSAKLANCPRVAAHIKASSSVSSLGDMLTVFFNDLNELVRHTDRSMIIYNGVEHLDPDTNVAQLDSTVVVMDWNARSYSYYGGPPGSSGARHKFMKMRASDGYYLTSNNFHALYPEESRLYDRWDVEPPETYLGAAIGVWLDYIYWSRDEYTELLLLRPRAILGDRTWNGSTTPDTVNDFYARLKVIGEPPGYEGFTERTRVDDGLPSHHYGFEDDTEVFPPTHFKNLRHGRTHLVRDEAGELHATSYNVTSPSVSADDKRFGASSWEFSKDGHGAGIGGVDIPAPWTMSIWVKRTADRVGAALMSSRSPAGERRYIRLQRSGTQVGIDDRKGLGCSFDYSTPLSEWTHLAFVADTATITLYVNGVPQSATCASMPLPMGAISARGNDSLRAYLDELKIWDETLSREQVERLAVSEAVSLPGPLTGFTVVDASDQTVVGRLAEGATLTLDDPASGSYGIRVDTESGAQIGSVRLELSGRKTVSRTENITPYSLHGDGGDGALHGEPLPAGSYTLRATAYEEQDLGGDVLGTLEVSFTVAAANTPATGAPTIGGTAQAGATLTADTSGIADADGLTNAVFSYQWIANDGNADTDIENETGSTYELSDDDVGKTIKVRVSFTDDADNQETLTSAATATVAARPNSPATGLPTISGTAQVDETLTADVSSIADADGLTNVSYSYQWLADEANIQSATNPTYTLADSDEGKAIKVKVSFTDDSNNEETLTSVATAAVAPRSVDIVEDEAAPLWSADMLVVEYTSVSIGAASADLFSHVWGSAGLQIKSLWSFTPDRDLRLEFQEAVPGAADLTMQVGDLALAFPAGSSGQSSFRWTDVDVDWEDGQTISVRIVPTSAVAARPNSPATGQPTISGTAQVGETLTADTSGIADADGLTNATFSYQWMAGGSDIPGATASSYTLTSSEQGQTIQVQVSFTDDADNEETLTSAATAAVAAKPNTPATGAPTISGTPQVGETLTADTSGIADTDGLTNVSYSYQWLADDANIDGATGSTYILANSDEGKAIKVRVSFTDDADNQETLTSAATAAVAAKSEQPGNGRAHHQRHGPGGRDVDGGHVGHRRRRRSDQCFVQLPVDCRGGGGHRRGHRLQPYPHNQRAGTDHPGPGELHRRPEQRGDSDQRGDRCGGRGGHGARRAGAPERLAPRRPGAGPVLGSPCQRRRLSHHGIQGAVEGSSEQLGH